MYATHILQLLPNILLILLKQLTLFKKTGGWNIKGAGNSKASKHTNTKAEAYVRTISINQKSELLIHGKKVKLENVIPMVIILILRNDNNSTL